MKETDSLMPLTFEASEDTEEEFDDNLSHFGLLSQRVTFGIL